MSAPPQRHGAPQQPPVAAAWCRLLTPNEIRLALSAGSAIRYDLVEIRGGDIAAHLSLSLADGSGSQGQLIVAVRMAFGPALTLPVLPPRLR